MKQFIIRTALFLLAFGIFWYAFSMAFMFGVDQLATKRDPSSIYIWGDSQTAVGVDLQLLHDLLGKGVQSLAQHGSGVYDLAMFVERIPARSSVVVGFSPTVFARAKSKDRNNTGFSLRNLALLRSSGYGISDIGRIAKRNSTQIVSAARFKTQSDLYEWKAEMQPRESLSLFEDILSVIRPANGQKQRAFSAALSRLRDKGCSVVLVDFPEHDDLRELIATSPYGEAIDQYKSSLEQDGFRFFTPELDHMTMNIMRDYSHLNSVGAQELTGQLATFLSE